MKYNQSILEMTASEAREFFLKPQSYFSGNLPSYFDFESVLLEAKRLLESATLSELTGEGKSLEFERNLNYKLMVNKDGKYAWRQLQIIHPVLYVDLVNLVTDEGNWNHIINKFKTNHSNHGHIIKCISMPRTPRQEGKELRDTVLNWWVNSEQSLIKNALEYDYCIQTDVTDCYPSFYTPTIAWALHGKEEALLNKDLFGYKINSKIQTMQGNNVCGIPQGSVLMDFIAEIILGYADSCLYEQLKKANLLSDNLIFRYRDDYKIMSNSSEKANKIMRIVSEVLYEINLKINSAKSYMYDDIILDGIKPDKLYWTTQYETFVGYFPKLEEYKQLIKEIQDDEDDQIDDFYDQKFAKRPYYKISIQKHLLQIKILGKKFPNCGQLKKALADLYKYRIYNMSKKSTDLEQLISITTQIMRENPTSIQHCIVIISKLLSFIRDDSERVFEILEKILAKFSGKSNTDIVEIWLQRIAIVAGSEILFKPRICQFKDSNNFQLWNSSWMKKKYQISDGAIINNLELDQLSYTVPISEVDNFSNDYPDREDLDDD
ncbi:RNA-directed DNA polymerase [Streptococcus pluranimalium]|uniref:RNA-directed DNA polymerase n=1 Tax=Streptococcus pluranimalium TaxID=82348 RepID=UPI0039FCF800